jgi:hypothetical protein
MGFALNEMRMYVSKLINKFEFGVDPNFKVTIFYGNFLTNSNAFVIQITHLIICLLFKGNLFYWKYSHVTKTSNLEYQSS